MKTLSRLLLLILPALLVLPGFRAAPPRVDNREVRQVGAFTEVGLANSASVVLRQGSPRKVELEGAASDLARVETAVENGKLRIRTKSEGMSWHDNMGKVAVYVTTPTINGLSVSGSGRMQAETAIRSDKLSLAISGSGELEIPQLQANQLNTAVSGSGSVSLAGTCPAQDVRISGSGGVSAASLRSETCSVTISGSGNCKINATKTLNAHIAGSGDVYVTGKPQITDSVVGSGRVHSS